MKGINFLVIFFFVFLYITFAKSYWNKENIYNKAVVRVPVSDASTRSLGDLTSNNSVQILYNSLPWSPEEGLYGFFRLHQLLFNEVVEVKRILGHEVECEFSSSFYYVGNYKKNLTFWTLKKNLIFLKDISNSNLKVIPPPYKDYNGFKHLTDILTLTLPWYDFRTQKNYSVGTRFIRESDDDTKNSYAVLIYDGNRLKISYVPKSYAIVNYPKNFQESISLFLSIIKKWIFGYENVLPYLWGGASYVERCQDNNFFLSTKTFGNKKILVWSRYSNNLFPYTGFDCSTLILRAAQIVGLPYYCKNTNTIIRTLRPLKRNEKLENGDLIWYPGHILIVSDIIKNKVIEAAGYIVGFGKLHEISLSKIYQNINTYKELIKAYHEKKSICRLSDTGSVTRNIPNILILKMNSILE